MWKTAAATILFLLTFWPCATGSGRHRKAKAADEYSNEYRLVQDLLQNYDPVVRPRINSNETVHVEVRFSLQQIYDLDEKRQILRMSGWLTTEWRDDFLVWVPDDYNGLTSIVLNPKHIWVPRLAIGNTADTMFGDYKHFWITVKNTGEARWQPGGIFGFTCSLEMSYYPFDDQACTMEVETWYYTSEKVNLTNSLDKFGLETYLPHGEWAVLATKVQREDVEYGYYHEEYFPEVYFTIQLRRKYTFYFMYILLPCIMLSFVLLMIFLLPADSGEKVSLGVSILIAMSVFLLLVAEQVPDTSDTVPFIAIFLMYFMFATVLSVVSSTFILKLHYRGFDTSPPRWLQVVIFDVLAPLLCLRTLAKWGKNQRRKRSAKQQNYTEAQNGDCHRMVTEHEESTALSPIDPEGYTVGGAKDTSDCGDGNDASVTEAHIEWKKLAEVLDRLFFWMFLLFIIMPSISMILLVNRFKPSATPL